MATVCVDQSAAIFN